MVAYTGPRLTVAAARVAARTAYATAPGPRAARLSAALAAANYAAALTRTGGYRGYPAATARYVTRLRGTAYRAAYGRPPYRYGLPAAATPVTAPAAAAAVAYLSAAARISAYLKAGRVAALAALAAGVPYTAAAAPGPPYRAATRAAYRVARNYATPAAARAYALAALAAAGTAVTLTPGPAVNAYAAGLRFSRRAAAASRGPGN